MDNHNISVNRLNLVAIVSLIIAAKIEDCDPYVPKMTEIHCFINVDYTAKEFALLERNILKFFDFDLILPTAATYIELFIESAISQSDLQSGLNLHNYRTVRELKQLFALKVFSYLEVSLYSVNLSNSRPSLIAAAILGAARKSLNLIVWPKLLRTVTGFEYESIRETLKLIIGLPKLANTKVSPESGYLTDLDCAVSDILEEDPINKPNKKHRPD